MVVLRLDQARILRKEGERLGRKGMSLYVIKAVSDFDGSFFGAIDLAGKLKALAQASKADNYWNGKMVLGYQKALCEIRDFDPEASEKDSN